MLEQVWQDPRAVHVMRRVLIVVCALGASAFAPSRVLRSPRRPRTLRHSATVPAVGAGEATELVGLLTADDGRGRALSPAERARVFELIGALEAARPWRGLDAGADAERELEGAWRLLFQGAPGARVSATNPADWAAYASGDGPSPLQNLVTTDAASVAEVSQIVDLDVTEALDYIWWSKQQETRGKEFLVGVDPQSYIRGSL